MVARVNVAFLLCLLALSSGLPAQAAAAAPSDWQVIKVGPRDYLTVDNVAKFYGFPPAAPVGKKIHLDNGKMEMDVLLDSREIVINGVKNWLCFPVIAGTDGKFLVSRVDLAKTLEPQLRPYMIANLGKIQTVVLDPGHGGHDKGAISAYGYEKDYALDVAKNLKPLLEAKGFKVLMTRSDDTFIPLEVRARIANATKDCVFVSIHFNATDANPIANGFEIFSLTPRGAPSTADDAMALEFVREQAGSPVDAMSLALSTCVYHSMLGHIPEFDRGVKRARFAVLRLTKVPAILVEGGFLTEQGESRLIADKNWRTKLSESNATGIVNYKALVDRRQRPMLVADYRRQLPEGVVLRDVNEPPKTAVTPPVIPASNISAEPRQP